MWLRREVNQRKDWLWIFGLEVPDRWKNYPSEIDKHETWKKKIERMFELVILKNILKPPQNTDSTKEISRNIFNLKL